MKAPTGNPSNSLVAHGAISALFIPEIAKSASTPEGVPQMVRFAFFEVGFIGRIVRVGFAFDFNVSFNGRAYGAASRRCMFPRRRTRHDPGVVQNTSV